MKTKHDQPPCANWQLWVGAEIEGASDLGERTIFVRFLPAGTTGEFLREKTKANRIWFCKEFTDWHRLRKIAEAFDPSKVCIEVMLNRYNSLPSDFRQRFRIYVKVPELHGMKPGDHVCIGLPFQDEAFQVGNGKRVASSDYEKDIRIL
jgi:hypothetical protein